MWILINHCLFLKLSSNLFIDHSSRLIAKLAPDPAHSLKFLRINFKIPIWMGGVSPRIALGKLEVLGVKHEVSGN